MLERIKQSPVLRGLPPEVGVISAIAFSVALGFGIVAPSIPIYAQSFGVTALLAGAVVSVFALMRFISAPAVGLFIDRAGERRILTSGLIIVAISSVMAGLAANYGQLLGLRGIGGIGSSMFTVSAMALMLKVVAANQRGRAAGAFQAGFLLGGVAGPAVGGIVLAWSIRAPFFVYAATLILAAVVAWRYLPADQPRHTNAPPTDHPPAPPHVDPTEAHNETEELAPADYPPAPPQDSPAETTEKTEEPAPAQHPPAPPQDDPAPVDPEQASTTHGDENPADEAATLGQALRMRAYWAALAANLTNGFVTFGLRSSLVPLFVIEGLRAGASLAGFGFLAAAATQAVLLLPAGRLADERGRRPALLIGASLTVLGMMGLVVSNSSWAFIAAMAVSGLAAAFMGSAPAAVAGDVVGKSGKGIVIAVFQMTADLGAIVGPLLAGLLADSLGFGPAFAAGMAVATLALIAAAAMPETLYRARDRD